MDVRTFLECNRTERNLRVGPSEVHHAESIIMQETLSRKTALPGDRLEIIRLDTNQSRGATLNTGKRTVGKSRLCLTTKLSEHSCHPTNTILTCRNRSNDNKTNFEPVCDEESIVLCPPDHSALISVKGPTVPQSDKRLSSKLPTGKMHFEINSLP